jgi:hypothetical protein
MFTVRFCYIYFSSYVRHFSIGILVTATYKMFFLQPSKKRNIYASLSSRKVCHFLIDQK